MKQHFICVCVCVCVCVSVSRQNSHVWGSESPQNINEHESNSLKGNALCPLIKNKRSYRSLFSYRTYSDWWHFSGYDEEHCFVSCSCRTCSRVTWCTTSFLPMCQWFSGLGFSWSLDRKRGGGHSLARRSPNLTPIDFFFWSFVKDTACREKAQSTN
jgi:hypothetical protein